MNYDDIDRLYISIKELAEKLDHISENMNMFKLDMLECVTKLDARVTTLENEKKNFWDYVFRALPIIISILTLYIILQRGGQ